MKHPAVLAGQAKRRLVVSWDCACVRCGHEWTTVGPEPPSGCANCRQLCWWMKRARGRPPKVPLAGTKDRA